MTDNSRVRLSIVGVVVIALFAALVGRLWFLQVAAGQAYTVEAEARARRAVQTESPRGRILDRNGRELVVNEVVWALTLERTLEDDRRTQVLDDVAAVLGPPTTRATLEERYADPRQSPLKAATIAVGVPAAARVAFLERREAFPGVELRQLTVRRYPNGRVASHVLGYVGEINAEELAERDRYQPGDTIGRAGVERAYESVLRGEPQVAVYEVDPAGRPVGDPVSSESGRVGDDVRLTIDLDVQRLAEESLAQGLASARSQRNEDILDRFANYEAPGGAVVVLDVQDGSVVAMASQPDYDPAEFIGGIDRARWADLNDPANHFPLSNRATQGQYAPGSTFKPISALALAGYGIRDPRDWIEDTGAVEIRGTDYQNAGRIAHGSVDLARALTVSSDVYFYTAGFRFWELWKSGDERTGLGLQAIAQRFGFERRTGVELDESAGVIPDPSWKRELAYRIWDTDAQRRENAIWYPADEILTSVGQGATLVTPLQLANAYATLANGGMLWRPHVGAAVLAPDGTVVRSVAPDPIRRVSVAPDLLADLRRGLEGAVSDAEGTAYGAFLGFPLGSVPVAGKTGTAQVQGKGDTSLFAAYFPANAPRYVVVSVVEEGGRGASTSGPIVRRIIEGMNGLTPEAVQFVDGRD